MKKTILTIMVAAMMLVAFTACEQQPINWPEEFTGIAVVETGDSAYLDGEDFDFRGIKVVAVFKDGTTEDLDNSVVSVSNGTALSSTSPEEVTLTYLGEIAKITPVVEPIASIEATTTETKAYAVIKGVAGTTTDPFKGDITVTAYNADKTLSRELKSSEYSATYDASETGVGVDKPITVTFATSMHPEEAPVIEVVKDSVVDFSVVAKDQHFYVNGTSALASNFDVYKIWASANGVADTEAWSGVLASPSATGLQWDTEDVPATLPSTTGSWSITLCLGTDESVTHSATLTLENQYKAVSTAEQTTKPATLLGGNITPSLFTVTATTLTSDTAATVPSDNVYVSTDGTNWVKSIYVSRYSDAKSVGVYIGVCMNDDLAQMKTYTSNPISVQIPENQEV